MNKEQWEKLIKITPYAQLLINENILYNNKEEQLKAAKKDGFAIKYICNPDKEVQLEAVKENGCAIQCIFNPDKDIQLAAINKTPHAMF